MTKKLDRCLTNNRPVFHYKTEENEVKAGGVLFYKKHEDSIKLLMVYSRDKYEDFGGRTDVDDADYLDTVAREVEEESNKIFLREDIRKRIEKLEPVYIKVSKYVLYFVELTDKENDINPTAFGDKEFHDDIPRTVELIDSNTFKSGSFIKDNLNFRLKNRLIFDKISSL